MPKQTREYLFTLAPFNTAATATQNAERKAMLLRAAKVIETGTLNIMEQRLKDDPRCQSVTTLSLHGQSWLLAECTKGLKNEFHRAFTGVIAAVAELSEPERKQTAKPLSLHA